jgi:PIN domain nuclease of toxin-antitoxin system
MEGTARLRLLLDTHIWLWSLQDAKRLGRRVRYELTNSDNELWLSLISTREALTQHAKGRIRLHGDLGEWMASATAPFREAPLTHEIALFARELKLPHQDPADRFPRSFGSGVGLDPGNRRQRIAGVGRNRHFGQPLKDKGAFLRIKMTIIRSRAYVNRSAGTIRFDEENLCQSPALFSRATSLQA